MVDLTNVKFQEVEDEPEVQQWKPEQEGETLTGVFYKSLQPTDNRNYWVYFFENENGKYLMHGTYDLDNKMQKLAVGKIVRITYKGTKPTKMHEMKIYKVEVAEEQNVQTEDVQE